MMILSRKKQVVQLHKEIDDLIKKKQGIFKFRFMLYHKENASSYLTTMKFTHGISTHRTKFIYNNKLYVVRGWSHGNTYFVNEIPLTNNIKSDAP